jgi:glycosyltransferase involved in cell wall biosynthesis
VYPADVGGCGYYRLIWVARVLAGQGHDITVVLPKDRNMRQWTLGGATNAFGELVDAHAPDGAEVVVLQRVTYRKLTQAVPMLRAKGIAVVIDIDDDLAHIHPSNPAYRNLHPRTPTDHMWRYAEQACRDATLVTVSTEALLARYAAHGRGVVLRNYVPEWYLDVPHVDSDVVGWGGAVWSHPDDLQQVGPAIARLVRGGGRFRIVGPPDGARQALGLETDPDATGVVAMQDWPHALAQLGIGIAPLADTKFNASKSRLKIIELMAVGVPWVASPRNEYARLHREHQVGLLAERPKDWYRHLSRLASDEQLRNDMSVHGRDVVAKLTIEGNAWRWMEAWEHAYRLQRQAAASAFVRT